jgi:hypothetical protein
MVVLLYLIELQHLHSYHVVLNLETNKCLAITGDMHPQVLWDSCNLLLP